MRNFLGIRPELRGYLNKTGFVGSDLYPFICGDNLVTRFSLVDCMKTYYQIENTKVVIVLYDSCGVEIRRDLLCFSDGRLDFFIDQEYAGTSCGSFYVFPVLTDIPNTLAVHEIQLTARGLVGFGNLKSGFSLSHGLIVSGVLEDFTLDESQSLEFINPMFATLKTRKKSYDYWIQRPFFGGEALVFVNPSPQFLTFKVKSVEKSYNIPPRGAVLVDVTVEMLDRGIIKILSDYPLCRPIIITGIDFQNNIDVHHG